MEDPFKQVEDFALNNKPRNDVEAFQQIADQFDPTSDGVFEQFKRGLQSSLTQLSTVPGTIKSVITGDEEELARIEGKLAAAPHPQIQDVTDVDSLGALVRYAAGLIGEQVPNIAAVAAGGGAASIIGRGIASRFLTKEAADVLASRAALAGVTGTTSAIEGAATAQEIFNATGDIKPVETTIAGISKGILESITPVTLAKRFGLLSDDVAGIIGKALNKIDEISNPIARRAISTAGVSLTEGVTETLQEAIDIATREYVDENFDILSPETANRLLNAFAGGALVGAVFGGAGEAIQSVSEIVQRGQQDSSVDRTVQEDGVVLPRVKSKNDPENRVVLKTPQFTVVGDPNVISALRESLVSLKGKDDVELFELTPQEEQTILLGAGENVKPLNITLSFRKGRSPSKVLRRAVEDFLAGRPVPKNRSPISLDAAVIPPEAIDTKLLTPIKDIKLSTVFPDVSVFPNRESGAVVGIDSPAVAQRLLDHVLAEVPNFFELSKDAKVRDHGIVNAVKEALKGEFRGKVQDRLLELTTDSLLRAQNPQDFRAALAFAFMELAHKLKDKTKLRIVPILANIRAAQNTDARPSKFATPPESGVLISPNIAKTKKGQVFEKLANLAFKKVNEVFPGLRVQIQNAVDLGTKGVLGLTNFGTEPIVIRISDRAILNKTPTEAAAILAHEIGHAVMFHVLRSNKGELLSLLREAYANFTMRAVFRSRDPNFISQELLTESISTTLGDSAYFRSFTEWFAREFAKWAFSKPRTFQEEIFARLAKKIRLLFKRLSEKRGGAEFKIDPDEVFRSFIERLPELLRAEEIMEDSHQFESPDTTADIRNTVSKLIGDEEGGGKGEGGKKKGIDKDLKEMIDEALNVADFYNKLVKWGFTVEQLAIKNPHIEGLQRYIQHLDGWSVMRSQWLARATETLRKISSLSAIQLRTLSDLTFRLDALEYLSEEEIKSGDVRLPTEEEIMEIANEVGADEAVLKVYERIRSDFNAVLDFMERVAIENAKATIKDENELAAELATIKEEFDAYRNRPYFPHTRFGQFAVTLRDKDGTILFSEQFESERQALKFKKQLEKTVDKSDVVSLGKLPEVSVPFMGLPAPLLRVIRNSLNLTAEQANALDQIIVSMSPERSFRRRFLIRKNIPGYSQDLQRVYSQYFLSAANFMARIAFKDKLQEAIDDVRKSAANIRRAGGDSRKRDGIADFLQDHLNNLFEPANDWAALRSLAAIWYLGFNVKAAFVNFTQVPLVAWPYLSARYKSDIRAAAKLKQAVKELKLLYIDPEQFAASLKDSDRKLFEEAFRQNFIDESLATELAQVAEGSTLARLGGASKIQRMISNFNSIAMAFFQTSEKINRRIVFKAAYDLAFEELKRNPSSEYLRELLVTKQVEFERLVKKGFTEEEAIAFLAGKDAVNRTQFHYSRENRPRFMRGKAGTVFTFFMFTQNMLFNFFNSPGNKRMLLLLVFAAGLMGLPGAEDVNDIVKFIGRKLFGKNFDPKIELKRLLISIFGRDSALPEFVLHGAARNSFGLPHVADMMGIPLPSVDLSRSLSFGRIVPGLQAVTEEGDDKFSRAVTDMAGAAFGIGINIYKALTDSRLSIDDFKRWERAMPRALANVSKGLRFLSEGRERNRTGATILEFDPTDPKDMLEIGATIFGFTPTALSRRYDRDSVMREAANFWMGRRSILMLQMMHALDSRERTAIEDAKKAIIRFNQTVPFRTLAINSKQLRASIKNRLRARTLQERGIPNARLLIPVAEDIKSLFPEVRDVSQRR